MPRRPCGPPPNCSWRRGRDGHILWKARERDRGHDALPPKEEVPDEHDIEEEAMTKEPHSHIELIKMVHCSKNGAAFVVWQAAQGAARQVRPERRWQSLFVRGFRGHFNLGLLVVPEVIHSPCYLLGGVRVRQAHEQSDCGQGRA